MNETQVSRLALAGATLIGIVIGCSDSNANPELLEPPTPLVASVVNANPAAPAVARVQFAPNAADSVRARYT